MNALTRMRKPEPAPAPMLPEQLRARIEELRTKSACLLKEQYELAERSVKEPAAEKLYEANIAEGAAVEGEIARLEAALISMERRAAEHATAQQVAELAGLRKRVIDLLEERVSAAQAFEVAIADAVGALHTLAAISDRALQAWPGAQPDVGATALGNAAIVNLVSAEMYRQGRVPGMTGQGPNADRPVPSLPGIKPPRLDVVDAPKDVRPLVAAITEANAFAREILEGRR